AAEERVVDRVARTAVVADRPGHALHGLLRPVDGRFFAVLQRVGNVPDGALLAVARPFGRAALAHRVPRRLVLPVVMTAAHHQLLLAPDQRGPQLELGPDQRAGDVHGVLARVPDVGDVAAEEI